MKNEKIKREKMNNFTINLLIVALPILLLAGSASAQQYSITKSVIGAGGAETNGGNNRLRGTISQSVIGISTNSLNNVFSGFWYQRSLLVALPALDPTLPAKFHLAQNYPNPFNPSTRIDFALPKAGEVRIEVFNMLGQRVAVLVNDFRPAGFHSVNFAGRYLASGLYVYRMHTASFTDIKRMMLLK